MIPHAAHSARLHALAAALCALLLLVALCVMDANHAPWWALLGTQGALLVATASAGMWLDRATGDRRQAMRGQTYGRTEPYTVRGTAVYSLPGIDPQERVFWQERARAEEKDDVAWQERVLRWNKEDDSGR